MKDIDSKIKKIASEEKFKLPTNYDNDFDVVINKLNEKKFSKRGYSLPILVVAICGVFFVTISVSVIMTTNVGARKYYMERFSHKLLEKHTEEISTEHDEEAIKEKEKIKKIIEQEIMKNKEKEQKVLEQIKKLEQENIKKKEEEEKASEQIKEVQSKMYEEQIRRKVLEEEKRKVLEEIKNKESEIDRLNNSGGAQ